MKPRLPDDDIGQYLNTETRLKRLEQTISPEPMRYVGTTGNPPFLNSWANNDASPGPTGRAAGFYRHNGRVYVSGVIKGGTSATVAWTFPTGYRPLYQTDDPEAFIVLCAGGAAYVSVKTNGDFTVNNYLGSPNVTAFCYVNCNFRHA